MNETIPPGIGWPEAQASHTLCMEEFILELETGQTGTCIGTQGNERCSYREGALNACAPLALAYVPMQQSAQPAYETSEALRRGTLFPGLDLPFMNLVNTKDVTDTPLGELMAIGFVTHELRLYLDTHPNDSAAFATMKELLNLEQEAHRRYVKRYGPLTPADLADSKRFDWLQDPWPWLYRS